MKSNRLLMAIACVLLAFASAAAQATPQNKLRVLFIGNSLTYTNDMPAMVAALAKTTKNKPLSYKTIALPNFSLEDHWAQGDARKAIAKGGWDFVVLQQGPSALPESRVLLREYVHKFDEEIRRAGARTAVLTVWPSTDRERDFERVIESHRLAAADVNGLLLPAGGAWRASFNLKRDLALYGADGFHPSELGSFLAACVIFVRLYGLTALEIPAKFEAQASVVKLSRAQVSILNTALFEALKN